MGKFATYSFNTAVSQFVLLTLSLGASIITARCLGPEGKGELTLLLLIPLFATTFGRLGLGHATNYYASRTSPTRLIVNCLILSLILSISAMAVCVPVIYVLKETFFKTIDLRLLMVISFITPFYILNYHFVCIIQGLYKINLMNVLFVVQSGVNMILLVILLVLKDFGLYGAVIATVSALLVSVFVRTGFLLKEIETSEIAVDVNIIKGLLSFGLKSHVGNILKDITYRGDILLISYFLTPATVGLYIVAMHVAEVIWKIPESVGSVLLPRVSQMGVEEARSFTPIVCKLVIIPVFAVCVCLFLCGKTLIVFAFGHKFLPSSTVLLILLPGIFFFAVWKIIANALIAQGYPSKYSVTSGVSLVTMLTLDIILIPRYGIHGAAVASTLAYTLATITIILIYTRLTGSLIKDMLLPVRADFSYYIDFFKSQWEKLFGITSGR
ncbi:MAG: oligosaccharide flippase family protein [Planctomycetes bacterium]|nr:oligosaccharide flippase family protein [Planctomycetota bacterium]